MTGASGGALSIGPIASDVAESDPSELVAVTSTRIYLKREESLRVYVEDVAPSIATQPVEPSSERSQLYVNEIGDAPVADAEAIRTSPSAGIPEIVGVPRTGGSPDGGGGGSVTGPTELL